MNRSSQSDSGLFGAMVKARRKALDLTQLDLAERAACAAVSITRIERGALRPSQQLADMLAEALRIPSNEKAEFLRLARGAAPEISTTKAGIAPGEAVPPTNLPALLSPLIGREREVEEAKSLVLPADTSGAASGANPAGMNGGYKGRGVRMLTLTGAPGIGKTSVAIEVARVLLPAFRDGVYFVPLASISRSEEVLSAVMQVLGLPDAGKQTPMDHLVSYLRERRVLLVLDNFEQVVAAGPPLAELLASCPGVQVIVTSREALRVRGECIFPVKPLALPDSSSLPRGDAQFDVPLLEAVRDYPAIVLFEQRAQEADPGFRLTDENARAVATICALLDGLPLAIELVAARLNLLSPNELLRRLQTATLKGDMPGEAATGGPHARRGTQHSHETLRLAAGGKRDLPARQQTLRRAIGWSYDLLSAAEQRLFRRLSVFAGGATLAAVEAVCDPVGDLGIDTLEGVSSLLARNLLRRGTEGSNGGQVEARIEMLETVREFALEQLEGQREEEKRVRRWHAEYFLVLIETMSPQRMSERASIWYDSLQRERSNIRAALDWSLRAGEVEIAARMALELVELWITGNSTDGRRAMAGILAQGAALPRETRAKVLFQSARLLVIAADLAKAEQMLNEGLPLLDDQAAEQRALFLLSLGGVTLRRGDWVGSRSHFELVVRMCSENGEHSSKEMLVRALNGLGEAARGEQDYVQARERYSEALALQRQLGEGYPNAVLTYNLSKVEIDLGNYTRARAYLHDAIALYARLGTTSAIAACLNGVAEALVLEWAGDAAVVRVGNQGLDVLEGAAVFFGAAQAEQDAAGYTSEPADLAELEGAKAIARAALGEDTWRAAWDRGSRLSIEQAVGLALHSGV